MRLRGSSIRGICLEGRNRVRVSVLSFLKKKKMTSFRFLGGVLVAVFDVFGCRLLVKIIVGNGEDSVLMSRVFSEGRIGPSPQVACSLRHWLT